MNDKEAQMMLEASVNKTFHQAFETTSGTIDKLMRQTRAEILDEEDGLNENLTDESSLDKR